MVRLHEMPGSVRLTVAGFTLLILSFSLLAQRNLWEQAGGGSMPTPDAVLERYHGQPGSSRLHLALDPLRDDDLAMYEFLGPTEEVRKTQRAKVLGWVERGAPESEWDIVAPIFRGEETCGQCHVPGGTAAHIPFENYAQVVPVTGPGMPLSSLLISAHNHMYAFAVLSLLLALGLCASRLQGTLRTVLIVAAFLGPLLDIGGWFLTRSYGAPFHWFVMLGGALFGAATTIMALVVLHDAVRGRGAST